MIDVLKQQFRPSMDVGDKINRVREFLQILGLKIIHDKGYFEDMAFVGGTALRILYDLRRFSEDLDFSVIRKEGYDFLKVIDALVSELKLYGFDVESKNSVDKTVQSSFLKFNNLLNELGLSQMKEQKLSIKVEVDSNPPKGWNMQTTLINKTYIFNISHFDLSSLYATKLHACFFRKFLKGRDFYDLLWYLGRKTKPNFILLNNAIEQTEDKNLMLGEENFKSFLLDKLEKIDFALIRKDVGRFLEDKKELELLDFGLIKKSIIKNQ